MKKSYYISTPIYYPSDKLHIGHTYTTVAADTMSRYKKLMGYDVFFLTGTDEHGQKIEEKANEKGVTPKEYVDCIVKDIKELWDIMDIKYDHFVRTTDDYHEESVKKIFNTLYNKGDIYKSHYEGWYCTPCEAFWTESQLVDNKCPDCGREVRQEKEEAYFFKMSKYADRLIKHIQDNKDFIKPDSRKNEMLNNFLLPGLQDLCVSRTSFDWGIPVEFDKGHVVYVWIDALSNYITALGYLNKNPQLMEKFWPADVHLIGKDILRFHTIYWPIMLMALDLPLPKQIFGHGWILLKGGKMSKSKGNVIDPVLLVEKYGVDALRYYVLREMPFGSDGVYNEDALINRTNSDLANDLGNLLSRTVSMTEKYFNGIIPTLKEKDPLDDEIRELAIVTTREVEKYMEKLEFSNALSSIWKLIAKSNKYIDETTPWILGKDIQNHPRLGQVLYNLTEVLRIVGVLIYPFMPSTSCKLLKQINVSGNYITWESILSFGNYPDGVKVTKGDQLFPRIDISIEEIKKQEIVKEKKVEKNKKTESKKEITIDDIDKIDLRIGIIVSADAHPNADKLLVLKINVGTEIRQIVSGIAKFYSCEKLIGKKVVVICNLKPVNLRGIESEGMILAASNKNELNLITTDGDIEPGNIVS
ncbi:methionine--tRNA ligase [Alkalibaculum sp. M08DMB]|uniref:Methionine--tRNA ligase n=1 Tax=Alkalibaculum sporogenes TaxID=2655001 RepID=A0A6A7K7V3_9FIRM|nr:methionine--tRNA ligase [Alkalibaculum sporogenes]MPW25287.1 methionine--tRNA ligase [Alkalibaculum sporogenes]